MKPDVFGSFEPECHHDYCVDLQSFASTLEIHPLGYMLEQVYTGDLALTRDTLARPFPGWTLWLEVVGFLGSAVK